MNCRYDTNSIQYEALKIYPEKESNAGNNESTYQRKKNYTTPNNMRHTSINKSQSQLYFNPRYIRTHLSTSNLIVKSQRQVISERKKG